MTSSYRVDARRIEHTLAALQEERELAERSRFGRISFFLLQIAVYSFPTGIAVGLLLLDLGEDAGAADLSCWSILAIYVFLFLAMFSLIPLLLLNLPMFRTIVRQVRLERKVDALLGAHDSEWTSGRAASWRAPRTRGAKVRRWLVLGLGYLMTALIVLYVILGLTGKRHPGVAVAAVLFLGVPAYFIFTRRRVSKRFLRICLRVLLVVLVLLATGGLVLAAGGWGPDAFLAMVPVLLVIVLPLLLLVSNRLLARVRERLRLLDDVEQLSSSLARQRQLAADEERDFVELAAGEAERLVHLESALNRQSQLVAIDRAEEQRSASYTTLRAQELRLHMESLDPRDRLRVESGIEELSYAPGIDTASEASDGLRRLPVAHTDLRLVYRVDDEQGQIDVLALERGSAPYVPETGESQDA